MPVPIRLATVVVASMALMVVSCAENSPGPSAPSPPAPGQPSTPTQPPPTGPTVVGMELVAPAEIAPGESVQLIAKATKSDGSVEDVSSRVVWSVSANRSLQLSPTGLATGLEPGEDEVVVRIGPPNVPHANKRIFVVPKGTFVLSGTIHDQGVLIPDVTVLVRSGTGQGLSSAASGFGFFRLYGVAGPVQLELKKNGFLTALPQVNVVRHMTQNFELVSERRPDYRGTYTLTLTASPDCTGMRGLPDEARRREYIATVSHHGAELAVSLSGGDFVVVNGRGNGFTGRLSTYESASFKISDASWDEYDDWVPGPFDVAERVGDLTVVFQGYASAGITASGFSGTFSGTIAVSQKSVPPFDPFIARCLAGPSSHTFEMVRR